MIRLTKNLGISAAGLFAKKAIASYRRLQVLERRNTDLADTYKITGKTRRRNPEPPTSETIIVKSHLEQIEIAYPSQVSKYHEYHNSLCESVGTLLGLMLDFPYHAVLKGQAARDPWLYFMDFEWGLLKKSGTLPMLTAGIMVFCSGTAGYGLGAAARYVAARAINLF